jgi:hypothetical protein
MKKSTKNTAEEDSLERMRRENDRRRRKEEKEKQPYCLKKLK